MDSETSQRLIPSTGALMIALFQTRDGGQLQKPCSMIFNPDDRSMWEVSLTGVESNDIIGSNVEFRLDFLGDSGDSTLSDASDLRAGMGYSILVKIVFDGEC